MEGQKGYTAGICPFSICENQLPLLHSHEQEISRTASENSEIFQRFLKNETPTVWLTQLTFVLILYGLF